MTISKKKKRQNYSDRDQISGSKELETGRTVPPPRESTRKFPR